MTKPRLTIGIPHLDRTEHLQHAIDSCLRQTVPVSVIVADQGKTEATWRLLARYEGNPLISHLPTEATCLWENWKAAAEACETEFFAWLQDDDEISRIYARRVIGAFDAFPKALHWQASCHCTVDRVHAVKWGWNGPQVPTLLRDAGAEMFPGDVLLGSLYFISWALSPGVAFRCGEEFTAALEGMPSHCDLFSERLILAAMGAQGPWVADSVTAGYWLHHASNESYRQNAGNTVAQQRSTLIEGLDSILDRVDSWDGAFYQWLLMRNPTEVLNWHNGFECKESRHADRLLELMRESLRGRIDSNDPEKFQEWLRGYHQESIPAHPFKTAPAPAPADSDLVLIDG